MSRQRFDTADRLRLQVEGDPAPGARSNLIRNTDGALGGWGWLTPIENTRAYNESGNGLGIETTATQAVYASTEFLPIDPAATHVRANVQRVSGDFTVLGIRAQVVFYNADLAQIGATAQTALVTADSSNAAIAATPVTAGTAYAKLRIDVYRSGGNPSAGDAIVVNNLILVAGTSTELAGIIQVSDGWVDVLGSSNEITVDRAELNLGTLAATIVDAALDPSQAETIRAGKRVHLLANTNPNPDPLSPPTWEELFTGTVLKATVDYDLLNPAAAKRARIQLSAVDQAQPLANTTRTEGVAAIDELPYVFEGCGVPWNVNGNTGHTLTTPAIVATNENAKAVDQVAITRDSNLGYAWFDRQGVVQVWDASLIGTDTTWPDVGRAAGTVDEDVYNPGVVMDYDTDRCINHVTIKYLRTDPATGESTEVDYGPYLDRASIARWGTHAAEFTVQGINDDEATIAAYAAQILVANATPAVRIGEVTIPLNTAADVASWALLDLYDLVALTPPTATP